MPADGARPNPEPGVQLDYPYRSPVSRPVPPVRAYKRGPVRQGVQGEQADGGGSNGYRLRAWKVELGRLATEIGRDITVVHFPPGTSKWNKVEHRLFSFISINWRGRPLTDYQVIVETIAATTTTSGLTVEAVLDTNTYPTGERITNAQIKAVPITPHEFHGEWNYTIHPGPTVKPVQSNARARKSTTSYPGAS